MLDKIIKTNRGNSFPVINKNLFDSFFNEVFNDENLFPVEKKTSVYPVNIVRVKKDGKITAIRIEYALAGFRKEEIKVFVKNGVLHIQAEHKDDEIPEEGVEETIMSRGISYKSFCTAYQLMDDADSKQIKSWFENGLLSVLIPVKEDDEANNIEIK